MLGRRARLCSMAAMGGVAADEAATGPGKGSLKVAAKGGDSPVEAELGLAGNSSAVLVRCTRRRRRCPHVLWSHSSLFRRRMAESCSALGAMALKSWGKLSIRLL